MRRPASWQRLLFWLLAPAPQDAALAPGRLGEVRADFHACVADLTVVPDAGDLVHRIETARTRCASCGTCAPRSSGSSPCSTARPKPRTASPP